MEAPGTDSFDLIRILGSKTLTKTPARNGTGRDITAVDGRSHRGNLGRVLGLHANRRFGRVAYCLEERSDQGHGCETRDVQDVLGPVQRGNEQNRSDQGNGDDGLRLEILRLSLVGLVGEERGNHSDRDNKDP